MTAFSADSFTLPGRLADLERTERGRLYYNHRNEQVEFITFEDLYTLERHNHPQWRLSDRT